MWKIYCVFAEAERTGSLHRMVDQLGVVSNPVFWSSVLSDLRLGLIRFDFCKTQKQS